MVHAFFTSNKEEFRAFYDMLLHSNDEFFVLKDFSSYVEAQNKVDVLFKDKDKWGNMVVNNIAHSGIFSSDRTISEYAIGIWNIKPFAIGGL